MKYEGEQKWVGSEYKLVRLSPQPTSIETRDSLVGDWRWFQSGRRDRPDVWLRFEQKDLIKGGERAARVGDGYRYIGELRFIDEGDLLIADHRSVADAEHLIDVNYARAVLKTKPAPELDCKDWRHTDNGMPVSMEALRGSVVLLDFWGGGYHRKDEQGKLQAIYQKYTDRGLMVVGIHSDGQGKKFEDLLKEHEFDYPVGLEKGDSAKRYGVDGYPTVFLIDKQGMVKQTLQGPWPSDSDIEELLDAN